MYNWLNWWVPDQRIKHYILFLLLGLVVLPRMMGIQFTILGYLFNLILLDVFYYWSHKKAEELQNRFKDDNE